MVCPTAKNKDLDLVLWFDTPKLTIETVTGVYGDTYPLLRQLNVRDALIILEVKSHNTYHSMRIQKQVLSLKYPDGWKNVTEQSNGQKHALISFLKDKTGTSPFVVNLIWLFAAENIQHNDAQPNLTFAM